MRKIIVISSVCSTALLSASTNAMATCTEQKYLEAQISCGENGSSSADFTSKCEFKPAGHYQVPVACPEPPPTTTPKPKPITQPDTEEKPYKDCKSPWGSVVPHGTHIEAFPVPTLPYGYTCKPHRRDCWDGRLGGGGTYEICKNV